MNEKGQKIFKVVIWAILLVVIGIMTITKVACSSGSKEYLTRKQWMKYMAAEFDRESTINVNVEMPKKKATGEFAVLTAMEQLGDEHLELIIGDKIVTDKTILDAAVKNKVIKRRKLDDKVTKEEAEDIMNKVLALYAEPAYYPQYFDMKTKVDTVDTKQWQNVEFNQEKGSFVANISKNSLPQKGQVLLYTDEYGITVAKKVKKVEETENGQYKVKTEEIDDLSEVMDEISFSGSASFGYLDGSYDGSDTEQAQPKGEGQPAEGAMVPDDTKPLLLTDETPMQVAKWEWFEDKTALRQDHNEDANKKCDIEAIITFKGTKEDKEKDLKGSGALAITTPGGKEASYKLEVNKDGKVSHTAGVKFDDYEYEFSRFAGTDPEELSAELGIAAKIKIEGLSISTSGYYQWADPTDEKNFVEAVVKADKISVQGISTLKYDRKFKVASVDLPIAASAGIVNLEFNLYIVVSAEGEVYAFYDITNPNLTMRVSTKDKFTKSFTKKGENAGVRANVKIGIGASGEVQLKILDNITLIDPSVEGKVVAGVSTFVIPDGYVLKEEYENAPSCIEMGVKAPTLKFNVSGGNDSVMYELMEEMKLSGSYTIFSESNAPWKAEYHVERTDYHSKINMIRVAKGNTQESVCTHIEEEEESTEEETEEESDEEDSNEEDPNEEDPNGSGEADSDTSADSDDPEKPGKPSKPDGDSDEGNSSLDDLQQQLQDQLNDALEDAQENLSEEIQHLIEELLYDILVHINEYLNQLDQYLQDNGERIMENYIEQLMTEGCESCDDCE